MGFIKIKKKEPKEAAVPLAPAGLPVDQVLAMRQQGYTNNQIIQALQRDGFTSQQVFDAIKQADLSTTVGAPIADVAGGISPPEGMLPPVEAPLMGQPGEMLPPMGPPPMGPPPMGAPAEQLDTERIEQIAEAIIDEKWEEFVKNINKLIEWKDTVESRIQGIEEGMEKVKNDFDKLHTGILGKIGEYDQNILNVGTEIKAMEKVFQKILPSLTDNVNKLSRITQDMNKK